MSDAERRTALAEGDARARRAAQECFDRPLVLEAGAGTGKTTALVARVLAWSLGPGWQRAEAALEGAAPGAPAAAPPPADRVAAQVLGRVVAITFTEMAAAEMSARIADALVSLQDGDSPRGLDPTVLDAWAPDERRVRARALLSALDHLSVHTIHAWCRRLLAAHPLEAGLHPQLEIDADGHLQAEVVREVLERHLSEALSGEGEPVLLDLAARGVGPQDLEQQLLELLDAGLPAAALRADPLAAGRVRALVGRLRERLDAFRAAAGGRLHGVRRARLAPRTAEAIDRLHDLCEAAPPRDHAGLAAFLTRLGEIWPADLHQSLRRWSRGGLPASVESALDDPASLVRAAAPLLALLEHLRALDLPGLQAARPLLGGLLAAVEAELRVRGIASFPSLLTGARDLLVRRTGVSERVRAGIDQLLVDEFQDTDRRQCDLVRAIALSGPPDGRPGLLIVGDPKQSIYGWRDADLAAYDGFVADVLAGGGRQERLSVNYRSVPEVLDEVERVIAPVMEERPGVQPAFQPLVPGLGAGALESGGGFRRDRFAPCEYWLSADWPEEGAGGAAEAGGRPSRPRPTAAGRAAELEAEALARDLRELHDEHGVPWKDFGVLFRSRTDWDVYLGALRARDIPFAVEGDRSYYQRREIIDAAAWVRCVVDPGDALALVAWLRSAAVGVPDAALAPLWARRLPERLAALFGRAETELAELRGVVAEVVASPPEGVPGLARVAGWDANLLAGAACLGLLRESFERDPADVFVERLRRLSLLEASESARTLGAWRCANLDRFFRELCEALCGGADVHAVLRRLRVAVLEEEEAPEARPEEILEDAVQIMTVHGAKGLGFEHVYLMQLHKGSASRRSRRAAERPAGGAAPGPERFEYVLLGAPTLDWDLACQERDAVAEAERVRTLYVAMTRARRRLVLAGLWPDHQLRAGSGQAVELLAGRREGPRSANALVEALGAAPQGFVDHGGARWRFPARAPGALAAPTRAARVGARLPLPDELRRDAHHLCAERRRARRHMARPLGARASDAPSASGGVRAAGAGARDAAAVAREVGTAVHGVLEQLPLVADRGRLAAGLDAAGPGLAGALAAVLEGQALEQALARAADLLARLREGELLGRLAALADGVVARELPVLLPPDPASAGGEGPVGYMAGAIDLLYRDPADGRLVVADYKTDRVGPRADPAEPGRRYAAQGRTYTRAVQEGFQLSYRPRFELWVLDADRVVVP